MLNIYSSMRTLRKISFELDLYYTHLMQTLSAFRFTVTGFWVSNCAFVIFAGLLRVACWWYDNKDISFIPLCLYLTLYKG